MINVILIFVILNILTSEHVSFSQTAIPKCKKIGRQRQPYLQVFPNFKLTVNCGTVGALMGIYLEGIFTTKADIEDDIHAYRHHDISLSSWSQDQALFFTAVITP